MDVGQVRAALVDRLQYQLPSAPVSAGLAGQPGELYLAARDRHLFRVSASGSVEIGLKQAPEASYSCAHLVNDIQYGPENSVNVIWIWRDGLTTGLSVNQFSKRTVSSECSARSLKAPGGRPGPDFVSFSDEIVRGQIWKQGGEILHSLPNRQTRGWPMVDRLGDAVVRESRQAASISGPPWPGWIAGLRSRLTDGAIGLHGNGDSGEVLFTRVLAPGMAALSHWQPLK